ncbi:MAG: hypothetical protein NZ473_06835 [Candidatus Kapabacteria bacterium]|nr:hypothetical protein [Candidatus Kapabacteria bacterium]MDW7996134.1 hypothetical protein [Bacteroidota bacterium]MDW8225970.1 hypothetical protein [Bacteroidota bacterium]
MPPTASWALALIPWLLSGIHLVQADWATSERTSILWLELAAEAGLSFSWDGQELLQRYRELTHAGDFPTVFPPGETLAFSVRIPLDSAWSFRLGTGMHRFRLDHTYRQQIEETHRRGERKIRAVLELHPIPTWLGVEWRPFQIQFRTYVHTAVGLVPLKLHWQELISSSLPGDTRSGGMYRNVWLLRPGIRVLLGTALSFDAAARGSLLEGLRIEAAYCFIPLRDALLSPVAVQLSPAPPLPEGPSQLSGSMVTLTLALVLQVPMVLP